MKKHRCYNKFTVMLRKQEARPKVVQEKTWMISRGHNGAHARPTSLAQRRDNSTELR